jgi:putative transposase
MARFEIPDGWVAQAYRFALDPNPSQPRALASHAGGARFAHNHMLALVKASLDQRAAERSYGIAEDKLTPSLGWSLASLRKTWNQRKHEYAPWWGENSKEAYNTGLDALARALEGWSKSRTGKRAGKVVGFPRFKAARARRSVRFTAGVIRVELDRHHVTLPRVGTIRTHESTRKLARRVAAGTARVLSATVSQDSAGRWHCAFQTIVLAKQSPARAARSAHPVVGVDVGVKADSLLVVATPDGAEVARVPAPKSLTAAQARLRALQRRAARQQGPYDPTTKARRRASNRWRRTQARVGKTHAHAAAVRRDLLHKGHHRARATAPGRGGGASERLGDALRGRCPQTWAQPRPCRRGPRGDQTDADLQDLLVRQPLGGSRPVLPIFQDVFGVRWAKAKPDPRRPHLHVRTLRTGHRP